MELSTLHADGLYLLGDLEGQAYLEGLNRFLEKPRRRFMSNRLIRHVVQGTLTRELYAAQLVETWHFVRFTPTYILTAASRLVEGHDALRKRFLKHAREELGHDQWALSDLEALGVDVEQVKRSMPLPNTAALVAYQLHTVEKGNPVGLLGLEYAMEGSTAESAGPLIARIKQLLGLEDQALRFFSRHAEVDAHHAEENTATLLELVRTREDRMAVARNARDSYILYAALYDGICDALGV